jgi:AcrR family transcriptional regulator
MGLRETKAEHTRLAITDEALGLFERQGYERTTVEQIAAAAGVGVATVYRYFPSKDLILLNPLAAAVGGLARLLDERPAAEDLDEALRGVVRTVLSGADSRSERNARLRTQLDRAPGPRARLWDVWATERALFAEAVGRRVALPADDPVVELASRATLMVIEMSLDLERAAASGETASEHADRLLELLAEGRVPLLAPTSAPGSL